MPTQNLLRNYKIMKIISTSYIKYNCPRCGESNKCRMSKVKYPNNSGTHLRIDCGLCKKLIKYVGKEEAISKFNQKIDQNLFFDQVEKQENSDDYSNKEDIEKILENQSEISFKLDLIIDHLNIGG